MSYRNVPQGTGDSRRPQAEDDSPHDLVIRARWIVPVSGPPIENGWLAVADDRVVGIGKGPAPGGADPPGAGELQHPADTVLLPGLINAHTHLELSALRPPQHFRDLPDWLMQVIAHQRRTAEAGGSEQIADAVKQGIAQCLHSGVSTVGDITRLEHVTRPALAASPLRAVSFAEVVGIGPRQGEVATRLRHLDAAVVPHHPQRSATAVATINAGLSPHAPYSIGPAGIRETVGQARRRGLRLAMHLAESLEELEFLQRGSGRFREMLEELGLWDGSFESPGTTPLRYADALGVLGPDCLVVHANYVDDGEIDLLCASGSSVAYCPRTHSYFRHAPHPVLRLMGRGVNVCIGTDSLASNCSLSLMDELRHARVKHPELKPRTLIEMATLNAARALGIAHRAGTLEPGKQADLALFRCADLDRLGPEEALLEGTAELTGLYIAGRPVG